jgi:hypothetical protein
MESVAGKDAPGRQPNMVQNHIVNSTVGNFDVNTLDVTTLRNHAVFVYCTVTKRRRAILLIARNNLYEMACARIMVVIISPSTAHS